MRVLVTGGAGFIGSYVVEHLLGQGHDVAVADRFTYAGKGQNLTDMLGHIDLLIGDLATGALAERCAAWQPEWVVHMAAETHVDRAISDPESFLVSNALGTTRLLNALAYADTSALQKILVYSTDEVYGPTPRGKRFDEDTPFKPSNAYSASKVAVEAIAHAFQVTHGLPIVIVRPCNTYGPRQHPEKVIPRFTTQALAGKPCTLYNDGSGARDWLYATDHARAVKTLLTHGAIGEAYNLAAEDEHSDTDVALSVCQALGVEYQATYTPGRPGHDWRYAMGGDKLMGLGWAPHVPWSEGLEQTVRWAQKHTAWHAEDSVRLR